MAKTADKAAGLSKVTSKARLLDKLPSTTALKNAGKNLAKNLDAMTNKATSQLKNLALKKNQLATKVANKLDEGVMKGSKKLGDTIDQMRHIMDKLTPKPALAMAGGGNLDDIGSTADKIQDIIKRTLKIDKSEAGSGVKISGAVEEVIEEIKAVEEKANKVLDDAVDKVARVKLPTEEELNNAVSEWARMKKALASSKGQVTKFNTAIYYQRNH